MSNLTISMNEHALTVKRINQPDESIAWSELQIVVIETNSAGPLSPDYYWILAEKTRGCVVPAGVEGEDQLLVRLQQLPGFDNQAVIDAMGCVEDKRFLCWKQDA
jgi:hypothetical protein